MNNIDRCNCGATTGLVRRWYHVGGQGYRQFVECRDQIACLARQYLAQGLVPQAPEIRAEYDRLLAAQRQVA